MVKGLPQVNHPNQLCEGCKRGKQHRTSFEVGKSQIVTNLPQLIYTDIVGPFEVVSLEGNKYFIIFIEDYYRKILIYFLKEKVEVLEKFENLRKWEKSKATTVSKCSNLIEMESTIRKRSTTLTNSV